MRPILIFFIVLNVDALVFLIQFYFSLPCFTGVHVLLVLRGGIISNLAQSG